MQRGGRRAWCGCWMGSSFMSRWVMGQVEEGRWEVVSPGSRKGTLLFVHLFIHLLARTAGEAQQFASPPMLAPGQGPASDCLLSYS